MKTKKQIRNEKIYTFSENIIIESINLEGYEVECDGTLFSQINNVHSIFVSEYGYEIKRRGEINAFKEWLQGLPTVLTVPFYNYDIINRAYAHDLIPSFRSGETTEEIDDKFLESYWTNLANAFFTLKKNL